MLLTALALVAVDKPPPPDVCPLFARLIAAAQERPAFSSIRQALAHGQAIVPGFDAAECEVAGDELVCGHRGMDANGFPDWRVQSSCPGMAEVRQARSPFTRAFAFDGPAGLRISYGVRCFQCAGPGSAWFRVGRAERRDAQ